jgi:hypothetical protein
MHQLKLVVAIKKQHQQQHHEDDIMNKMMMMMILIKIMIISFNLMMMKKIQVKMKKQQDDEEQKVFYKRKKKKKKKKKTLNSFFFKKVDENEDSPHHHQQQQQQKRRPSSPFTETVTPVNSAPMATSAGTLSTNEIARVLGGSVKRYNNALDSNVIVDASGAAAAGVPPAVVGFGSAPSQFSLNLGSPLLRGELLEETVGSLPHTKQRRRTRNMDELIELVPSLLGRVQLFQDAHLLRDGAQQWQGCGARVANLAPRRALGNERERTLQRHCLGRHQA